LGYGGSHFILGVVYALHAEHAAAAQRGRIRLPHRVCTIQHAFVFGERVLLERCNRNPIAQELFDTENLR
jgi:hypothetical protein